MDDKKIADIQAEINRLEKEKEKRIELLADPKRQEIQRLWEQLVSTIDRLNALGEDVSNEEWGCLAMKGVTFSMEYDGKLVET